MTNSVFITGTIVHLFDTQRNGCAIVTVDVGHRSFPKVVLFKALAQTVLQNYQVGSPISLEGFLVSSVTEKGKTQSIFGRELCSEIPDTPRSDFHLQGTVLKRQDLPTFSLLQMLVNDNGHLAYIPVSARYEDFDETITRGSNVSISGYVRTRVDRTAEEPQYFQNYFATDIKEVAA